MKNFHHQGNVNQNYTDNLNVAMDGCPNNIVKKMQWRS